MTRPGFHKLRITADSPIGHDATVELDDRPFYASRLTLNMGSQDVTQVTVTFDVDDLDVTTEALALFQRNTRPADGSETTP